jgi:hypothetical protein
MSDGAIRMCPESHEDVSRLKNQFFAIVFNQKLNQVCEA